MDYSSDVLGQYQATKLRERTESIVLTIGSDTFTRADLARAECFNYVAAQHLSHVLSKEMKVKSTRQVFDEIAPADLALPGIGVVALAVLGAAFEVKRLGGDAPLHAWVKHHGEKIVTFDTYKTRAQKEEQRIKKDAKRHKRRPAQPALDLSATI